MEEVPRRVLPDVDEARQVHRPEARDIVSLGALEPRAGQCVVCETGRVGAVAPVGESVPPRWHCGCLSSLLTLPPQVEAARTSTVGTGTGTSVMGRGV